MSKRILSNLLAISIFLLLTNPAIGVEKLREKKVPNSLSPGLKYLINFIDDKKNKTFDVNSIADVIDFVRTDKDHSILYYMDKWESSTAAYSEFNIKSDLSKILRYTFNPEIPSFAFRPSSLRNSKWLEIDGSKKNLPKMWEILETLDEPFLMYGIEHEDITPDISTGTYYSYDMKRAMIICRYKGRKYIISISKQPERSTVGQKGAVLGVDEDWNYFYSGIQGVTKKGLGWANAYMYRALSIAIYFETDAEIPSVKCATFKWLRAGWARFNMVKRTHIVNGIKRYARDYKFILEHPDLPEPDALVKRFAKINDLSPEELKKKAGDYISMMLKEYGNGEILSRREFSKLFKNGAYLKNMKRDEMVNMVAIGEMKDILGKGYKGTLFLEQP